MVKQLNNTLDYKDHTDELLNVMKVAAKKAGTFLKENFGGNKKYTKKDSIHWGIKEDLETDKIIKDALDSVNNSIGYYSEEHEGALNRGLSWVVDPIEGTTNYRLGIPFFATQIALAYNMEPVIAVIYEPFGENLYYAIKNKGSFLNNEKIFVSNQNDPKKCTFSVGKGTSPEDLSRFGDSIPKLMRNTRSIRNYGACGLEMAYVARGSIDYYLNFGSKLYDYLPGVLLIREAGGSVLNLNLDNWTEDDKNLIAGNNELVKNIIYLLSDKA